MARDWVLDTDTKGTGAEMVPLEKALERKRRAPQRERASAVRRSSGAPAGPARPEPPRAERLPPTFKVVDVMSRQVLAEGTGTRETVEILDGVRSVVDVHVYVSEPETGAWRPLTLGEQKRLWRLRGRAAR
jgi:hypothetical protein